MDGFVKFFIGATRPSHVTQKQNWNTSVSTNASLSPKNSLSYPVQYTNSNALLGILAEEVNRFALNPQKVTMAR